MTQAQEKRLAQERESIMRGLENYSDETLAYSESIYNFKEVESLNYELYQVERELNKEFCKKIRKAAKKSINETLELLSNWKQQQREFYAMHRQDANSRLDRLFELRRAAYARIDDQREAEGKERLWTDSKKAN